MPSTTPLRRVGSHRSSLLVLSAVLGLACGGGTGSTPPPIPPAIGAAGGTVSEPSGASVVVPPGALGAETTIQIAKDSTGAPALPAGLVAAGSTYVVTPHGGDFAQPVEVRIPAPGVTLQPNQELKLAKAQPGGEWLVLGDSELADGVLSAQVSSFSFFVPVTITYLLPLAQQTPLQVQHQPELRRPGLRRRDRDGHGHLHGHHQQRRAARQLSQRLPHDPGWFGLQLPHLGAPGSPASRWAAAR